MFPTGSHGRSASRPRPAARRENLVYVQLLEGGRATEDAFYYTMYDAISRCE